MSTTQLALAGDQLFFKIAMVDDHHLFRNVLAEHINTFPGYQVTLHAGNGRELTKKIDPSDLPDVALLDITMPEMDGYATATWLSSYYPSVKILALSGEDTETAIIRMLKCGARGYVLKDAETSEFRTALDTVTTQGFYYSELVSTTLMHSINGPAPEPPPAVVLNHKNLSGREKEFLKLACSELTYKEIADRMCLSARTIDGYREDLFIKLGVRSRVGLVIFAIRQGWVTWE